MGFILSSNLSRGLKAACLLLQFLGKNVFTLEISVT